MDQVVFSIASYIANTILLGAVVIVGIPLFSSPSKEQLRQGRIWGAVLLALNVGLLLVLSNHSIAVQLWRYGGILVGGVLTFKSLTRAEEPAVASNPPAAAASAATQPISPMDSNESGSQVRELGDIQRVYGLWTSSRSAAHRDAFLDALTSSAPALSGVGMTAEDLRRQFPEAAELPEFETVLAGLG